MFRESKRHVQSVLISNINDLSAKQKKRFAVPEKESTVPWNGTNDPSDGGIRYNDQYAGDTQLWGIEVERVGSEKKKRGESGTGP